MFGNFLLKNLVLCITLSITLLVASTKVNIFLYLYQDELRKVTKLHAKCSTHVCIFKQTHNTLLKVKIT